MEVEETLIMGTEQREEGHRRMELFIREGFLGGRGFLKYLERCEEEKVVEGTTKGRDTGEDVEGGGRRDLDSGRRTRGGRSSADGALHPGGLLRRRGIYKVLGESSRGNH